MPRLYSADTVDTKINNLRTLSEIAESQIDSMFNGETVIDGDPDPGLIAEITETEIDEIF